MHRSLHRNEMVVSSPSCTGRTTTWRCEAGLTHCPLLLEVRGLATRPLQASWVISSKDLTSSAAGHLDELCMLQPGCPWRVAFQIVTVITGDAYHNRLAGRLGNAVKGVKGVLLQPFHFSGESPLPGLRESHYGGCHGWA